MRLVFSLFIEVYDNLSIDYACMRVGQIIHFECYIRGFRRVTVMFQFEQYYFGERYYFNDRIQFLLLRAKFWLFFSIAEVFVWLKERANLHDEI